MRRVMDSRLPEGGANGDTLDSNPSYLRAERLGASVGVDDPGEDHRPIAHVIALMAPCRSKKGQTMMTQMNMTNRSELLMNRADYSRIYRENLEVEVVDADKGFKRFSRKT